MQSALTERLRSKRLVVFDFDGTLADTRPAIVAIAREVLMEHGLPEERLKDVGKLVGPPFPQAFTMVFGYSAEEARVITNEYRALYWRAGARAWPLFDGVGELLRDIRASGRLLATASSKRQALLERCIRDDGVFDLFDLVWGKQHDDRGTKAETLAEVLGRLEVPADDAVMVGDRHFDVEAARDNDVACIGVEYGHTAEPGELADAGAVRVVGSVRELGDVLLGA